MLNRKFFLLALSFLTAFTAPTCAQDQSTGGIQPGNTQGPYNPVDCTDPMMAGSPQCAQQNQGREFNLPGGNPNVSPGTLPTGQIPGNMVYRDNGTLAPQFPNQNQALRTVLPPEPLTEFQKFVASSTSQVLPVFGADLFRYVPSTFAPLDMTPVPPDYVIGPGDELRVRVWGQVNFNADLRVDREGEIYLPQVGNIHVAGLPFSGVDGQLRKAIGRVYRNFDLTANIGQIRAIQIYLAGRARRAGVFTVSSLSTLVDALFASGGPSVDGSMRHIQLKREGQVVTEFDLYALLIRGDKSKDVKLLNGDVIFIPSVGPQVAVTGSVKTPAIYEMTAGESIGNAVTDAGGPSTLASGARVSVQRIADHRDQQAMEVAMDAGGLATPLSGGDILRVLAVIPRFQKTVTLRGNTANPGHFAWHEGMRLSDLIPDRDSLLSRDYWWKRAQLGFPSPEFEPVPAFSTMRQPLNPVEIPKRQFQPPQQPYGPNVPGYPNAPLSQQYPPTQQYPTQQQPVQQYPDQTGQQNYDYSNYPYPPPVYDPNYPNSQANPYYPYPQAVQRAANSSLAAQQAQMQTQNISQQGEKTDVRISAPEIDWDYAVIERLDHDTLKTSLIPFDLGKLVMQHDQSQNLELQPGDVVSVFSQGDIHVPLAQQTKYVRLEGEFVHSGIYSVHPGEGLRDLVQRAGGLTSNAYLFGSEFTRESTRLIQQARIDEYVQNLELQITRGTLGVAASPVSNAQDVASGAQAQASGRELIARLRQIRATGRIVLEFNTDGSGQQVVPDLPLEDGDRFIVPPVPSTINVVGAVYDQNSFLYQKERPSGAYLHLAGGPNRNADKKHSFIIRADGSVVSWSAANGLWGNTFEQLKMFPGDTIVVPEKGFQVSGLRSVIEWSQLFSQFALGAASLAVIAKQ
ncbi:MAG: polysaccharide export protein [Silvibacterium sp.]|nr:polysaccharide export protein [Silvibacterium sp.]